MERNGEMQIGEEGKGEDTNTHENDGDRLEWEEQAWNERNKVGMVGIE